MVTKKRIPEGSVRRTKVVKIGSVKATVILQKKRKTLAEKTKARKQYQANKHKMKVKRKLASAKRTTRQKLDAAIKRAISKAVRDGKSPYQAAARVKARYLARKTS